MQDILLFLTNLISHAVQLHIHDLLQALNLCVCVYFYNIVKCVLFVFAGSPMRLLLFLC